MRRRRWHLNKWFVLLCLVTVHLSWGIYKLHLDYSLWRAAWGGDIIAMKRSLDRGANPNARWQATHALGGAIWRGHRLAAFFLLRRGADPDLAVSEVIRRGDPVLFNAMLSRGLNVRGKPGRRALILAVGTDKPEMVALLLKHGADPYTLHEESGYTVLENAKERADHDIPGAARVLFLLRTAAVGKEPGTLSTGGR